eukprot:TRINITY_DN2327_c0_g1_i2.p1 TRINITY_DN2327_c0_g1~~TRINITY_DN2327_c0_g1_i2.p1  ORF type:complete len:193 (+),score=20.94 TRINITY_DN2327_c0_g1_i2:62-580(+)
MADLFVQSLLEQGYVECENRPWASEEERQKLGCKGRDFVKHKPKIFFRFFWSEKNKNLKGIVTFGAEAEGPPGGAHGGGIALVFDEILAYPVWRSKISAFTANLNVNYRRPIPLGSTVCFESAIEKIEGRKHYVKGKLFNAEDHNVVYSEGNGLWLVSKGLSITPTHLYSKL